MADFSRAYILFLIISLLAPSVSIAAEPTLQPVRAKGLSVHFLPDRVAQISGQKGGFTASLATSATKGDTYPTVNDLLEYFDTLDRIVQENGIWVVSTNPDAYSPEEDVKLKTLISVCIKRNIPIFTCRGKDLPDGWQRH